MTGPHAIAAGILGLLLVTLLAAPFCAAAACDPHLTYETPVWPAGSGGVLERTAPDCCSTVPVTAAVSPSLAVPVQLTARVAAASTRSPSAVMLPPPTRTGRTSPSLHRTLRL